jgi:hypothetical protein
MWPEWESLRDERHLRIDAILRHHDRPPGLAEELKSSAIRNIEECKSTEQRSLAAATGPDNAKNLPSLHPERDVSEKPLVPNSP